MSDKQRPRRPKAIVTRRLPEAVETRMAELFDVELNLDDKPFDRARLEEAVARADVLVATLTDQVDADVIGQARPRLKLIANSGTGVDNIVLTAAQPKAFVANHIPGVVNRDTIGRESGRARRWPSGGTPGVTATQK